uniref:Tetraspanin n=1 Tax=Syphacia muris TaxID=451379 RepID=A0A0N5ASG3_9BILA
MSYRQTVHVFQIFLLLYTVLIWVSGFAAVIIAFWTIKDPRHSYILDLVDFSERFPFLRAAAYGLVFVGLSTIIVGFVSCCASTRKLRCPLITLILFLILTLLGEIIIGILAISYRRMFTRTELQNYTATLSKERYSRVYWVTPLMDTIQYYQHCCGGNGPLDYMNSYWYKTNTLRGTRSFVPPSCCKQTQNARAWDIQPIDPMCTTYSYYSNAFNSSVNIEGCASPLLEWLNTKTTLFIAVAFSFAALQLIGICLSGILFHYINTYYYIRGQPVTVM